MRLDIPDVPPSPNRLRGKHWGVKKQLGDYWSSLVRAEILPQKCPVRKRKAVVVLHHSRLYDKDNAYASVKPVVDALTRWGLIVDDSKEWLDLEVQQAKCLHKQRHTVIEIEPAGK